MKTSNEKVPYFSAYPLKEAMPTSGADASTSLLRIADTAKKVIRVRILPMTLGGKIMSTLLQKNISSTENPDDNNKDWFKSYE